MTPESEHRRIAAADALGSMLAEGLEPGPEATRMIERWIVGEIDDEDLEAFEQEIVYG